MESGDREIAEKRAIETVAVALLGWILYAIIQSWTPHAVIGVFIDLLYMFFIYLLMPFAFSALLLMLVCYVVGRMRGYYYRDVTVVVMMLVSLAFALYVTGPVMGEIVIIIATAVFLVFRLIRQFM